VVRSVQLLARDHDPLPGVACQRVGIAGAAAAAAAGLLHQHDVGAVRRVRFGHKHLVGKAAQQREAADHGAAVV
jgi:hypothetical protein